MSVSYYIPNSQRHAWTAQSRDILKQLGVKKIPAQGLPPRLIMAIEKSSSPDGVATQGVALKVWATPLIGEAPRNGAGYKMRRMTHRLLCECPGCGEYLSAGRLHQHRCKD